MAAVAVGMCVAISTAGRLEAYFCCYQQLPTTLQNDTFERDLLEAYTEVLRFIARVILIFQKSRLGRIWNALLETPDLENFGKTCDTLDDRLAKNINIRSHTQLTADLKAALGKLDDLAGLPRAMVSLDDKIELSKLRTASGASYNSHADEHLARCLEGTRTELLKQIVTWADGPHSKSIFWLCGMAGTGKSTIARTVAEALDKQGRLGASFFFKRDEVDRGNTTLFFPTIALQFTNVLPDMGTKIADELKKDWDLCGHTLQDQFDHLLLVPLLHAVKDLPPRTFFIVIDALDECNGKEDIRMLLRLLSQLNNEGGPSVRILVTSRPDTPSQTGFGFIDGALHEDVILEEAQATAIEDDLRIYLERRFGDICTEYAKRRRYKPLPADWPGNNHIEALVKLAAPLFIFASTVCRYISEKDPEGRLRNLLCPKQGMSLPGLNDMYLAILKGALTDSDALERDQAVKGFRTVVGSIAMLADPLSANSLSEVLKVSVQEIEDTLEPLHSVLQVPTSATSPIQLFHSSFREFLTDSDRRSSNEFHVDEVETHTRLAEQCLQLLSPPKKEAEVLSDDLCKLGLPGARRADYSKDHVTAYIQPEVVYACCYWAWHMIRSKQDLADDDRVHQFLQRHFLHWLEALSWLGRVSSAIGYVIKLQEQAKGPRISEFLEDARRFLLRNRRVIDLAPLQVYYSALCFLPTKSVIRTTFKLPDCLPFSHLPQVPSSWSAEVLKLEGHIASVNAVAFSPNGSLIASGSDDHTVRLWTVSTGEEVKKLKGHKRVVNAVAFSPNGSLVASASSDWTVQLWTVSPGEEAKKPPGEEARTLKGHTDWVMAVAFSPDNSLVASASRDRTVRLWTTASTDKEAETPPLEGHECSVNAVAFSPDGSLVASASDDWTVRLWTVSTGKEARKVVGHIGCVRAVAFFPDGSLVASAYWNEIVRLWTESTGKKEQKLKGHYGWVMAVAFSPDSSLVASASNDSTVRLWTVSTSEQAKKLDGHNKQVRAVAFSHDGSLVASASRDRTVRLWTVLRGEEAQKLEGHDSCVTAVAFSPDGSLVASASVDQTVHLWNASKCEKVLRPLKGHTGSVNAVAFSPDGSLVASASNDYTVRLWNVSTGEQVRVLEGYNNQPLTVDFSLDGSLVKSAFDDRTVRHWVVSTGVRVQPMNGGSPATQIVFPADGQSLHANVGNFATGLQQATEYPVPISPGRLGIRDDWVYVQGRDVLRLPDEYQYSCSAVHEGTLVIGHRSGAVSFFKCK